ncbi:MAG: alpha-amylase family glycosyl hydrolase [Spirochaetales bacterium]|nr:alpha-amylase family glycosyl hydrolase [Spirochaetales bacterium]
MKFGESKAAMTEIDKILPVKDLCSFTVSNSDGKEFSLSEFLRLEGGSFVTFKIIFSNAQKYEKFFLHTDIKEGAWTYIPFEACPDDPQKFLLRIKVPIGGYFSCHLVALSDHIRYWEASEYHQLLFEPPTVKDFRMYTMIPSVSGDVKDWITLLDHIKELGFNVVHLLPFTKTGSSMSPYAAVDLFSIDQGYADSEEDFEAFIQKASKLGIKICYDIVLNHVSSESLLVKEHANWIVPDKNRDDGLKRAGCWHMGSWISWEDLVLVNYKHTDPSIRNEIYNYMLEYVLFWTKKAERCGTVLRLDNLHSSDEDFMRWLIAEVKKSCPCTVILSEYFGADKVLEDGVKEFGLNMLTANSWEYPFAPLFKKYLSHIHKTSGIIKYFLSPTSHDTGAIPELFGDVMSTIPRFFCCALMGTGQMGIVQGFESGIDHKIDFIRKPEKIELSGLNDFSTFIRDINHILDTESCFLLYKNIDFIDHPDDSLIVCVREDLEGRRFLLVANFNTVQSVSFSYFGINSFSEILSYGCKTYLNEKSNELKLDLSKCGVIALLINEV